MKKYGIFIPSTGEYIYANTLEELQSILPQVIIDFYLIHANNQLFAKIVVNSDGSETWSSDTGVSILSPEDIKKRIISKHIKGAMPVTII